MIYKDSSIPSNFNKIAEISNNFIVWVKESTLNSGQNYDAYYQYINPSTYVLYTENYKIKNGTTYVYNAHYTTNNMYSYLDYYTTDFSLSTLVPDDDYISDSLHDRADIVTIFLGQILCCVCILWVFHNLSRLFFKGGL